MNHAHTNSVATPCVMVIFADTCDLTKRKLIPALSNLAADTLLSKPLPSIGFAGNDFTTETFGKTVAEEMPKYSSTKIDPATWAWFAERIYYIKGDFQDPEAYKRLAQQIADVDKQHNTGGNKFFYLAVAPRFFSAIAKQLGQAGLTKEESGRWARVIVEKPLATHCKPPPDSKKDAT